MNFFDTVRLALGNIWSSKMRTFLTMLGVIIGVTSVILIVGMGNGMEIYMQDSFATIGTNSISVTIIGRGSSRRVSVDDMYDIVDRNPDVLEYVSPTVSMSGSVKIGTETSRRTSVSGVSEDYFSMKDYDVEYGRALNYMDIKERKPVCVIGKHVNEKYFNGGAVGDTLKIGSSKLKIVGVMEQEDDDLRDGGTDDCVYLPYSYAARASHIGNITSFTVTSKNKENSDEAVDVLEDELFNIFEDDDSYMVISMAQILSLMTKLLNVETTVLAIIAGISLVVGGIGIMNIMLVSVTERTREIGIRKALGAKERVIMAQFVTEAAVTSVLGGLVGIGLGFVLSDIATKIITSLLEVDLKVIPSAGAVAMAVGISAGIGILFGYLPAKKAANLNPIDALRYE